MAGINDKCIACGTCAVIASELFVVDGIPPKARVTKELTPEDETNYKNAQSACPAEAIENF